MTDDALTDHDDRVRLAGVLGLVLVACGLSAAILFVLLQLASAPSGRPELRAPAASITPPAQQSAKGRAP